MVFNFPKSLSISKVFKKIPKLTKEGQSHKSLEKQNVRLAKDLEKNEKNYIQKHNDCVDKLELRNKNEGGLLTKAINVGTQNGSVQRVGLHIAQSDEIVPPDLVTKGIDHYLESNGIDPKFRGSELCKGGIEGITETKAKNLGMSPEQYTKPTGRNYIDTGVQALKMTPDVAKTVHTQTGVVKSFLHFGKAKNDLKETRMADLINKHGSHLVYDKHGKIKSGSLQASSSEELARMLGATEPPSNIKPSDMEIPLPDTTHILPPKAPEKLPVTPSPKEVQKRENAVKNLSPKEITEKELAEREKRIAKLDADLRKEDPVALKKAIQERDLAQVDTGLDVAKGVINQPRESAMLGVNYLWNKAGLNKPGKEPLFTDARIHQAEHTVGHAIGEQLGKGNAEKMVQKQVEVETRHAQGKPLAKELFGHYQEKAMEKDLNMSIDDETGDKFYDTWDSTRKMNAATKRYEQEAREKLPRPEDTVYLQDEVTHLVPGPMEGLRRVVTYDNEKTHFIADIKDGCQQFLNYWSKNK